MGITELFEQFSKHVKESRDVDAHQDHKQPSSGLTKFNYDIHDDAFVDHFEKTTGIMVTKMKRDYKEILHCDADPINNHTLATKQRLQDYWERWNVQNRR